MIDGALIGKLFKECSFNNYIVNDENRIGLEACKKVALRKSTGVVLTGKVGTGKTHLLVALAHAYSQEEIQRYILTEDREGVEEYVSGITQRARNVQYWPILDLVSALREEIKWDNRYSLTHSEKCQRVGLLIIDDFGQERFTDFVLEEIEKIIDYRYRDMRPIAIATNLTMKEIHEKYGDRAISRWMQQCDIINMGGGDYRKTNHMPRDAEQKSGGAIGSSRR